MIVRRNFWQKLFTQNLASLLPKWSSPSLGGRRSPPVDPGASPIDGAFAQKILMKEEIFICTTMRGLQYPKSEKSLKKINKKNIKYKVY